MLHTLAPLTITLAAVRIADAVGLALLLLFALWGLRRGALRQVLSFGVVVGALFVATWLAPQAESTVAKVTSLVGDVREAAAWGAVLFAALVLGGVALSYLCCRLPARAHGRGDRLPGALFGGLKGAPVLVALGYVLAAVGPGAGPSLARTSDAPVVVREDSAWVGRLRGSLSAGAMARGADWIGGVIELPAWIERRRAAVDAALQAEAGSARRPRQH